jgi:omega-amidase
MPNTISVTLLQTNIIWENPEANRDVIQQLLLKNNIKTELILLPETFTTGFSMNAAALAEPMNGNTIEWMRQLAEKFNTAVAGSVIIKENNHFYNRFIFITPDNALHSYDKRHLFRMGNEDQNFSNGTSRVIINYKGIKILPQVCYDLRFPVWSRNRNDYDLAVYVANWPASRIEVWNTLLKARAIENQAYVIGVNRVGTDGNGIEYCGESQFIDPYGNKKESLGNASDSLMTISINIDELNDFRSKFPVWKDADEFRLI